MYVENYFYNPLSSSLESYDLMTFNGIHVLAPRDNLMNGIIKLSGNLSQLISKNMYTLFAISDYLIEHRHEIKRTYKEKKSKKLNWSNFLPSILISFSADESDPNSVNLTNEISKFPLDIEERKQKIIHNLESLQTGLNLNISDPSKYRNIFYCEDISQTYSTLKTLVAEGYLKPIDNNNKEFIITSAGKDFAKKAIPSHTLKTAFIAMSFSATPHIGMPDDDLMQIRSAFKEGIKRAGYIPIVIDEKKHNNYIPLEIENQIMESSFLVQDLTYKNEGAIYEAGLADGKGKPVIRCIRKKEFDDPQTIPHFDYRQKSMIIWTTYDELAQRLEEQIKETIGKP